MSKYRRSDVPGACYFFTVITYDRNKFLTNPIARKILRSAFTLVQSKHPFIIEAIVLLPNHIHTIWRLPEDDSDFSSRWSEIKSTFTREYLLLSNEPGIPSFSQRKRKRRGVWQKRYWEHLIRNDEDFMRHLDYIHYNPVKHGHVESPKDWEWSSFHRYVKMDWYNLEWGSKKPSSISSMDDEDMGE